MSEPDLSLKHDDDDAAFASALEWWHFEDAAAECDAQAEREAAAFRDDPLWPYDPWP